MIQEVLAGWTLAIVTIALTIKAYDFVLERDHWASHEIQRHESSEAMRHLEMFSALEEMTEQMELIREQRATDFSHTSGLLNDLARRLNDTERRISDKLERAHDDDDGD